MKTFKHILVPTDFEKASAGALEIAVSLARACDAKVTLLHVWEIPIYPYMDFMLNSEVITRVEDAAVKHLSEALEKLQQVLPNAASKLKTGQPGPAIVDAIEELKPDLVVMGTHGRHGLERAILGSVAEKLVRSSPVPVLTVHAPSER
ncbi:MAG TPA: universal stress protein [Polyangiaceae bacterium]|nr:universal stress protein [Polyangiaceae bacterium]